MALHEQVSSKFRASQEMHIPLNEIFMAAMKTNGTC